MAQVEYFDVVILGSGQGGKQLAWHLARAGKKVATVERRWVGGSCPAVACLPSKNEIWSARIAHVVQHAGGYGTTTGEVRVDMAKVRARKQAMIEREIAFHLKAYKESGAELTLGSGRFVGPKTMEVALNEGGTRLLTGGEVVINVGTHAAIPNVPGIRDARPLTHIEALELDYAPAHLIVLGGGYVGVEMAQAYRRFGSRVTIIEPGPQLMGRESMSRKRCGAFSRARGSGFSRVLRHSVFEAFPVTMSQSRYTQRPARKRSTAATSWSRPAARRTPPISASTRRGSSSTSAAA
jgi:pyruvate/2-oxoglutarate dehydrogenase complex dihydrolipoamide dehydrogenase (E3) component